MERGGIVDRICVMVCQCLECEKSYRVTVMDGEMIPPLYCHPKSSIYVAQAVTWFLFDGNYFRIREIDGES